MEKQRKASLDRRTSVLETGHTSAASFVASKQLNGSLNGVA